MLYGILVEISPCTMARTEGNSMTKDVPLSTSLPFANYADIVLNRVKRPEFMCGWGAAFVNISVTFPINKIMFRQQLYGVRTLKAIGQLRKEGLTHIYRGLLPPLLQKTTSMSLMFGLYYEFQRQFNQHLPLLSPSTTKVSAAMLAGTVEAILTPFERVQVLMQDRKYHNHYNNSIHALRELHHQHGIKELYRGQMAILLRNGPSNVLFFLGRDYCLKSYSDTDSASQKVMLDFISGALLGACISTVFYPLNVVKVRMQSQVGTPFSQLVPTFKLILTDREYRLTKIFRGVHINYTRALISWGIVNATYEFLMQHFFTNNPDQSS